MGRSKKTLKQETVMRIRTLLRKYPSQDEMLKSKEYNSLYTHYMNAFEKSEADKIIDLCKTEYTFDEIKFVIEGDLNMATAKNKTTKKKPVVNNDPVEQETIFLVSEQRVVDAGEPVTVTIGDDENTVLVEETADVNEVSTEEKLIIDQDNSEQEEDKEPIILEKVIEDKKNHNKSKKSKTEKKDYGMDDNDTSVVIANTLSGVVDEWGRNVDNAIAAADKYVENFNARMEVIDKESEKRVADYIAKMAAENPEDYEDDDVA